MTAPVDTSSGVFDDQQAATLLDSDQSHWWFRAKAGFVTAAIDRHVSQTQRGGWLVDLGAGAGGVTAGLGWSPLGKVTVDGFAPMVAEGTRRHKLRGVVGTVLQVPLNSGSADVVTLLDVIEHVPEPEIVLTEARRVLKNDGVLVVTVPGHQRLWSGADELLGHVKRYNRALLRSELTRSGFHVVECSHIFSWLVPPVWAQRRFTHDKQRQLGLEASSPTLDKVAATLCAVERRLTSKASLPFGTSVLAVARPIARRSFL
jgi:SAM-dependent methyltransferase